MTAETLSPSETDDLRRVAGLMVPASEECKVPGADDPKIFADIEKSIGRDMADIRKAMAALAGISKLDDANEAGGRNSDKCTLILTEGDSAKALAISGLSVVGRDYFGVFPVRRGS